VLQVSQAERLLAGVLVWNCLRAAEQLLDARADGTPRDRMGRAGAGPCAARSSRGCGAARASAGSAGSCSRGRCRSNLEVTGRERLIMLDTGEDAVVNSAP
jgi:hypothetical protein